MDTLPAAANGCSGGIYPKLDLSLLAEEPFILHFPEQTTGQLSLEALGIELFNKLGFIWTFTTLPAVFTQIVLCLNILSENYVIIEPITAKEKEMTTSGNYAQLERQRVEKYLENEKPYLNPEFKITDMAKDLFSNRTYISAFINREYGMNFNRFINNYRLKEVERL